MALLLATLARSTSTRKTFGMTGTTTFDISMSLDGYMTAAQQTADEPMGNGGLRLVDWALHGDERDRAIITDGIVGTGAVICGRRTYDTSLSWWGVDGPTGDARLPVFVLSHTVPDDAPSDGVYRFVNGVDRALAQARDAAGGKGVTIMGGAQTGQQFLAAGLVDELSLHLVPVLLGSGTRMFEHFGDAAIPLTQRAVLSTDHATHFRFAVTPAS